MKPSLKPRDRLLVVAFDYLRVDCLCHRSLGKDAPISRSIERLGKIESRPLPGGLHHHYGRI